MQRLRLLAAAIVPLASFVTLAQPPAPPMKPEKPATPGEFGPASDDSEEGPYATAALLSESSALVPGSVAILAVHFSIAPGWHTYWNGRNDTGFSFKPTWTLPEGYEVAGPMEWPAPIRHTLDGEILDHVYEQSAAILVPIRVPASAKPGDKATIAAHLAWLVCKSACVFEEADVTITLPIAEPGAKPAASSDAAAFAATREQMAKPLPPAEGIRISFERILDREYFVVEPTKGKFVEFYPDLDCVPTPNLFFDGSTSEGLLRVRLGSAAEGQQRDRRVSGIIMISTISPKAVASNSTKSPADAASGNKGAHEATGPQFFRIDMPLPEVSIGGKEPAKP